MNGTQADRRQFLNRYYGTTRHVYDLTRKYYLFGRDQVIRELLAEPWQRLVEIGPGTGRNLRKLQRRRPSARFGGIEASDEMLSHARARCPWATLRHGFADGEEIPRDLIGAPAERILFSYCLSMMQDPARAIDHARRALAPGGEIVIVDFADCAGLPAPLRAGFGAFLRRFHVAPLEEPFLRPRAAALRFGPARYYVIARVTSSAAG